MEEAICLLGADRPVVCKEFPKRQSDINHCGASINEISTCVAQIGGAGCNRCGQCCRDHPWSLVGSPETNNENWLKADGSCKWLMNDVSGNP